jgi:hypothetical protein
MIITKNEKFIENVHETGKCIEKIGQNGWKVTVGKMRKKDPKVKGK